MPITIIARAVERAEDADPQKFGCRTLWAADLLNNA
jgi:hypothetical protein